MTHLVPASLPPTRSRFACALSATLLSAVAAAQCGLQPAPGLGPAGLDTQVNAAVAWDPDGPGPRPAVLVCAGYFTLAGRVPASRIAAWDPVTGQWSQLGPGLDNTVFALAVLPGGDLVAGGYFTDAGGSGANSIARWDGSSWGPLGAGTDGGVFALCVTPNGDLVAGGRFTTAGGVAAANIARWDGNVWSALGAGVDDDVMALCARPNGDVFAGGRMTQAGGVAVSYVARWNGSTWSSPGGGVDAQVRALRTLPNGDVVCGGFFYHAGGTPASFVARWNGAAWAPLGAGMPGWVFAFAVRPNGNLVAGGYNCLREWNGATWSGLGGSAVVAGSVGALAESPNGELAAGGSFFELAGAAADHVAIWNGTSWRATAAGTNAPLSALAAHPGGGVIAGGYFTTIEGVAANRVARWHGASWSPLGAGLGGPALALAVRPNGDVVAGGGFSSAGGVPAINIAVWDGAAWSALGAGLDGTVAALAALPNGDVVAGGWFYNAGSVPARGLARWNGSTWSAIGGGLSTSIFLSISVSALAVLPNGDLVVAGSFQFAGGLPVNNVARWDGSSWHALGGGLPQGFFGGSARALAALPDGDLVAAGSLNVATPNGIAAGLARWDGAAWWPLGSGLPGFVEALCVLPDGDLVAGGLFTSAGGAPAVNLARWDGAAWSGLAGGTAGYNASTGDVAAIAMASNGDLVLGGSFTRVGSVVAAHVARLVPGCPANAVGAGAGCRSSGGNNALTVRVLPWAGGVCRTRGTGMAPAAVVAIATGFLPISLPLSALSPLAGPGCTLHTTVEVVEYGLCAGGLDYAFFVPDAPALVGVQFVQQMLAAEFDTSLQFTSLTATDAVRMTIGSL